LPPRGNNSLYRGRHSLYRERHSLDREKAAFIQEHPNSLILPQPVILILVLILVLILTQRQSHPIILFGILPAIFVVKKLCARKSASNKKTPAEN
jgi:hypothetical protein